MIYTIKDYYDDKQQHVREYEVIEGEAPDNFPHYIAVGHIELEVAGMGTIPRSFGADINAENLVEAFEKVAETIEKEAPIAVEKFKKEIAEEQQKNMKQIITPNNMPK